MKITEENTI